jgi:hypothetical protein
MADAFMSRGQTEAVTVDPVSDPMFMSAATRSNDFDGGTTAFSDGEASWIRPLGHSFASHAIVVVARARVLRLGQAPALRK